MARTTMSTLDAIAARRSSSQLIGPGPNSSELRQIIEAAAQAPDHGCCRPWSFIVIPRTSGAAFGELLATAYVRHCQATGATVDPRRRERERVKVFRAPVYLVAACRPRLDVPIPLDEQFAAVAAAVQNLLLAATALGFGSKWVTGAAATDPLIKRSLGLDESDGIVGFVHLGTVPRDARQRPRSSERRSAPVTFWKPDEARPPESIPLP